MKSIIFDLDGVLVFTDKLHYQAWKKMADDIHVPFDEAINNRLRGVSRMASLEIILEKSEKKFSQKEKEQLAEKKNTLYRELLTTMTPDDVSDDVRTTLSELKKQGYRLAIGSSSKNTKFILEQVKLSYFFDAISDGTNITNSKPDPEVFLKAAQFLAVEPSECIVVEDAYSGIDAAKAAGMQAIGIGDASSYDRADWHIHSFCEILNIVKNM